jgi:5-formyltetrahydrofolate cyclo-ligase
MTGTKDVIRREMLSRRRALSPLEAEASAYAIAARVLALDAYRSSASVVAYVATDGEVPTGRLIAAALGDGKAVFLPRVAGAAMTFTRHRHGEALLPGRFGIPEALGEEWTAAAGPTLVLVPLVAWDSTGARLGRGGGFYDRALATFGDDAVLIGLAYAFQRCANIPRDAWDVPLDLVVCEEGVRRWDGDGESPVGKEETTHHGNSFGRGQHRSGRRAGVGVPARAPE